MEGEGRQLGWGWRSVKRELWREKEEDGWGGGLRETLTQGEDGNEEGLGLKAFGSRSWTLVVQVSRGLEARVSVRRMADRILTKAKPEVGIWSHSRENEGVHQE